MDQFYFQGTVVPNANVIVVFLGCPQDPALVQFIHWFCAHPYLDQFCKDFSDPKVFGGFVAPTWRDPKTSKAPVRIARPTFTSPVYENIALIDSPIALYTNAYGAHNLLAYTEYTIISALTSAMKGGKLPGPSASNLYVVFPPDGAYIGHSNTALRPGDPKQMGNKPGWGRWIDQGKNQTPGDMTDGGASATQTDHISISYHDCTSEDLNFCVVGRNSLLTEAPVLRQSNHTVFDLLTILTSHEIMEAISDPVFGDGWTMGPSLFVEACDDDASGLRLIKYWVSRYRAPDKAAMWVEYRQPDRPGTEIHDDGPLPRPTVVVFLGGPPIQGPPINPQLDAFPLSTREEQSPVGGVDKSNGAAAGRSPTLARKDE